VGRKVTIQHRGDGAMFANEGLVCSRFKSADVYRYLPCTCLSEGLTNTAVLLLNRESRIWAEMNGSFFFTIRTRRKLTMT
jgi:hypothetical protein